MLAVDTNVLVRILTRDDATQANEADSFIEQGAWVSVLAFAEAIWVLGSTYGMEHADIATSAEMLLAHEHLTVEHSDTVAAALELFRSRPALGFTDCLILELARKAGHLPLGTFDRALGKASGAQQI